MMMNVAQSERLNIAIPHLDWRVLRNLALATVLAALAACTTTPRAPVVAPATPSVTPAPVPSGSNPLPALPAAGSGRGGYYLDDGPGDHPPDGLLETPDPMPKVEPYASTGNRPYVVFGKTYTPMLDDHPFKQRGTGSWYGKKFHGHKTSSGELYDMYKLTAAHPTLPIPSYARVTNLSNGKQVIVRINDRGPFHTNRIIDLSYTAALKLGYLSSGSSQLEVERLLPDDIARINAGKSQATVVAVADVPTQPVAVPVPVAVASAPAPLIVTDMTAANGGTNQATPPATIEDLLAQKMNTAEQTSAAISSTYYLQFGAYGESANAEAARSRLMQNWDSALPPLEVIHQDAFYRLHSGPYASRAEAAEAALKLQSQGDVKAMIVQR
jgi:rare lipoprotein A